MLTIVHEQVCSHNFYLNTSQGEFQRNRLRQRVLELEEERDGFASKNVKLQQQITTLRADNVKLYEKIKYLQNYTASLDKASRLNPNQLSEIKINVRQDSQVEQRYKDLYEDQINPFADFR